MTLFLALVFLFLEVFSSQRNGHFLGHDALDDILAKVLASGGQEVDDHVFNVVVEVVRRSPTAQELDNLRLEVHKNMLAKNSHLQRT